MTCPVEHRGQAYPTQVALADALGVTTSKVFRAVQSGDDLCGASVKFRPRDPVQTVQAIKDCAEAGMCKAEAGRAIGISEWTVRRIAERHGIAFINGRIGPAASERLREKWKCPDFRKKRLTALAKVRPKKPEHSHLRALRLSGDLQAYKDARAVGCSKDEALRSIRRADLIKAPK